MGFGGFHQVPPREEAKAQIRERENWDVRAAADSRPRVRQHPEPSMVCGKNDRETPHSQSRKIHRLSWREHPQAFPQGHWQQPNNR